jgi:hypothetical protein
MRKKLVITDLTQMPDGNAVCVVGIDEQGKTIRPIHEKGFLKNYLFGWFRLRIFPRAVVEFDFIEGRPQPPHIEDMAFKPKYIKFQGVSDETGWERTLLTTSFDAVDKIYEGNLQYGKWVLPGADTRSIATLTGSTGHSFIIEQGRAFKPRMRFMDASGNEYNLPVNDLAIRELCFSKVVKKGESVADVAGELNRAIKEAQKIYLRIGLSRPYSAGGAGTAHCYPQITGIHTFPDYLKGKTFADVSNHL